MAAQRSAKLTADAPMAAPAPTVQQCVLYERGEEETRTFNRQPKTGQGMLFRVEAGGGSSGNGGHRRREGNEWWRLEENEPCVACLRGAALKSTTAGAV
jgi:hypothetical protein